MSCTALKSSYRDHYGVMHDRELPSCLHGTTVKYSALHCASVPTRPFASVNQASSKSSPLRSKKKNSNINERAASRSWLLILGRSIPSQSCQIPHPSFGRACLGWPLFSHRALVESCKLKRVLRSGQGTAVTNEFITCIAVECDELRILLIDWVALWRIVKRLL